ncbi:cold shock protein (beta-ribbon, CspA family) [Lactobacillus bombicola]|jgi:cold shock protein|uniref:Cold shock domain-containing protein n=1 Tax=Lactobacillus bombicola TaxID=1505723 RepID=A0A1I1QZQ1_9LACO|nr:MULTISPECIES: cold shock domain-containing protein [Lactobacillus]MCO6528290.1 cold shock domain-containing protein [Lactobacillus sp.]RHW50434.1 cold shock domain-containing protein [Lactobacillus bombicola]RHW53053.1 cold shock domain-containing protein [Lactobacillus bombicola]RHW54544.1 cold shock domain-containing protein [Lactobacillus bombicola]RMC39861.1 cold shock domain-containing protein [Lactobacillus sp. ESL0237]
MRLGTVKQFDQNSSFGFIEDDQNHKSYFVFYTAIKEEGYRRLQVGQKVKYQLAQGKNGLQCVNVYLTSV